MENYDVIIVGAGPVGLTLALLLKSYERRVAIIEKYATRYALPRAVNLRHENLRVYDSLGLHNQLFAEAFTDVVDNCGEIAEWIGAKGQVLLRFPIEGPCISGRRNGYGIHQPTLEKILENECIRRGVHLIRSTEVKEVLDLGTHVEVYSTGPNVYQKLSAPFVVGCDGANSVVRQSAGLKMTYLPGPQSRWCVVDVIPKCKDSEKNWQAARPPRQYLDPLRPRTQVPSPDFRRRWEFMLLSSESDNKGKDPEFIWSLLEEYGCTPANAIVEKVAVYKLRGGWCESHHKGRILLAGDAAHVMPPFLAQGLNTGIRDAFTLAWRLDLALQYPERNWEKYYNDWTSEQMGITKGIVQAAVELENIFSITDPLQAHLRDEKLPQMRMPLPKIEQLALPGMFAHISREDRVSYNEAGHMFIDGDIRVDEREGRLCDIFGSRDWLVIYGPAYDSRIKSKEILDVLEIFSKIFQCKEIAFGTSVEDATGRFAQWFEQRGVVAVLLRPDHYIYGTAWSNDDFISLLQQAIAYSNS